MRRAILAVALLVAPTSARATTIIAAPEVELVRRAATIAVVGIIHMETKVDAGGRVVTRAEAQVYRAVRGASAGDVLTIQIPGGRIAGLVAHAPGAPRLEPGRLYLGFFDVASSVHRPLGLSYGLLNIHGNAEQGYTVTRVLDGLHMVTPTGRPVDPQTVRIDAVPLEQFVARIERRLVELGLGDEGTVRP